jgi:hypothetical protein
VAIVDARWYEFFAKASLTKVSPTHTVIPAKAGIQGNRHQGKRPWIPAFAGMTEGQA